MRKLGSFLMLSGAAVGGGVGVAMLSGIHLAGLSWLVTVGLIKLTLLASGGLMAAGAVCVRLARRDEQRKALDTRGSDSRRR